MIPFSTEDRGGEERVLFENIAGKDLAKLGRSIPSAALGIKLRPYKGVDWNGRVRGKRRG